MKLLPRILFLAFVLFLFADLALAQITTPSPKANKEQRQDQRKYDQDQQVGVVGGGFDELYSRANRSLAADKREDSEQDQLITEKVKKYSKLLEKMLIPAPEYQQKYADSIKNEKMYLARIFPDKNCDLFGEMIVSVQDTERCEGIVPYAGGGSKYSFREKSNVRSPDIHYIDNKFMTGDELVKSESPFRNMATGMISEIGNVNLENITLSSTAAKFLTEVAPKKTLAEFEEQNKLLEQGINSNSFIYSISAPLKLNSAYVLRSIVYKQKSKDKPENNNIADQKANKLMIASDVSVAFKVVGQEPDGSVILFWKYLK